MLQIVKKNIFTVLVSKNDQLLVEEELVDIADLRALAIAFLDNGARQFIFFPTHYHWHL